ncbi:MAG: lactate utilization protein, partial [Candidatus Bathyarchaeia archaeon]
MFGLLEAREWYERLRVENTLSALERNGFDAVYYPTAEEALAGVLGMVPDGVTVGFGGSVTLREMGLVDALEARGVEVANHWKAGREGASPEEVMAIRRAHINSDVFITSTNAVTETGELVNIDGTGQRVAAMIFGPKKVIVVVGVNKITGDLEE